MKEDDATSAALRASEERFRLVLEESPIGLLLVDERGAITLVNKNVEQMFGYDRAELVGRPVELLLPARLRDRHPALRRAFMAEARPRTMGSGRELRGARRDGSEVLLEIGLTPLAWADGTSVLVSLLDISARVQAEALRRESTEAAESFQFMVSSIDDYAIFRLDAEGRVETWNAGARAINGYEAGEIIGEHLSKFFPPADAGRAREELRVAAATGRYQEDGWRVRKDGSRFWANSVLSAIPGAPGQGVRGFVKVVRDLSERKRAEDAKTAALAERTALLQEVHHRVKNNLQMIASLLNLQARQVRDEGARASLLEARGRVRAIAMLHESLYQAADLGRVAMPEYVAKLVIAVGQTLGDALTPARIAQYVEPLHFSVDVAVPCGLIIHELVMNSLKHAFAGRALAPHDEIYVSLGQADGTITLVVADTGAGFGDAIEPSTEETMGLTLVRDLAAQLRGEVSFSSGHGARCEVRFPAPRPRSPAPPARPPGEKTP